MTFREILSEVINWLQQDERISYRALRRQFNLDDDVLDDLKVELIKAKKLAVDEDGEVLVWIGEEAVSIEKSQPETDGETRFHAVLPFVLALLQREQRVTYRLLKDVFGLNDTLLAEICEELDLRQLTTDEGGKVLVWTGKAQSNRTSAVSEPNQQGTREVEEAIPHESVTVSEPIRSARDAEHRQLTVMFCDLVGSTDLSGKLDPESLREVIRAYQETAAQVIQHYNGYIAQYLGDGLLIYFGWPQAHENDAERAVYTGLGIPEAIDPLNKRLQADHGVQLAVRIGIHTGPVVVGEMGSADRYENLALGETPNIAARLEGLAQANTVVISPATAQLVQRSFVLEELGLHELKGVAEPMLLYTVVSAREPEYDDHEEMLSGGFDALVGRDEEIGLLLRRWEQSKESQGQVVLMSGEAGLGKSSLVEGLRAHVHQEGYTRIAFRCSPYTTNSALHPVIEHMQRVLGWKRDDTMETRLDKLEQAVQQSSLPMEETVPLLGFIAFSPNAGGPIPGVNAQSPTPAATDTRRSCRLDARRSGTPTRACGVGGTSTGPTRRH